MMTAKEAADKTDKNSKAKEARVISSEREIIHEKINECVDKGSWTLTLNCSIHEQNKKMLIDLGYSVVVEKSDKVTTKISWGDTW
jgi:hypothetical protein